MVFLSRLSLFLRFTLVLQRLGTFIHLAAKPPLIMSTLICQIRMSIHIYTPDSRKCVEVLFQSLLRIHAKVLPVAEWLLMLQVSTFYKVIHARTFFLSHIACLNLSHQAFHTAFPCTSVRHAGFCMLVPLVMTRLRWRYLFVCGEH